MRQWVPRRTLPRHRVYSSCPCHHPYPDGPLNPTTPHGTHHICRQLKAEVEALRGTSQSTKEVLKQKEGVPP